MAISSEFASIEGDWLRIEGPCNLYRQLGYDVWDGDRIYFSIADSDDRINWVAYRSYFIAPTGPGQATFKEDRRVQVFLDGDQIGFYTNGSLTCAYKFLSKSK